MENRSAARPTSLQSPSLKAKWWSLPWGPERTASWWIWLLLVIQLAMVSASSSREVATFSVTK